MTLYQILGVNENASFIEIRSAYRRLSKIYHPDIPGTGSQERFNEICKAHDVLTDHKRRDRYDRTGDISEGLPENHLEQVALALISQAISLLIGAEGDLRTADLKGLLTEHFNKSIGTLEEKKISILKNKERARSIAGRWRSLEDDDTNLMEAVVNNQFEHLDRLMVNIEGQIQAYGLAIEILSRYEFNKDELNNLSIYNNVFYGVSSIT